MMERGSERIDDDNDPRMRIHLWDAVGLGIILAYPSGIWYGNQTGGTACLHPWLEGLYVPLSDSYVLADGTHWSRANDLRAYFEGPVHHGGAVLGLSTADADYIDAVLMRYHAASWLRVDRTRLRESHEAWVWADVLDLAHVSVHVPNDNPPITRGVLTWTNSD